MTGHRARKRFGQNFLSDASIVDRMVGSLQLKRDDQVIEVGPGLAALTLPLLDQLESLIVVEIDRDLVAQLESRALPGLRVINEDVLKINLRTLFPTGDLRVVGNLPYNIGTPLLLRLIDDLPVLRDVHVMLQKEVVDRLHAEPGSRAFGRLSVLMQLAFRITPLWLVPPSAFEPPPKVTSAVVRLVPREDAPDTATLAAVSTATRLAFASKRKTLRNNFRGHVDDRALRSIGIDPGARAETLAAEKFLHLAGLLQSA